MSQTTLARIQNQEDMAPAVSVGFGTLKGFEAMQRMANLFGRSSIVPDAYRSKGDKDYTSMGNCVIALDMALRMGANPLMVMQNLYVVHGRPAWSAQFLIATLNQSGKFSALRYEFQGKEGTDEWGCRAVTTELATGERLTGPLITIDLAKKEGWYGKNGSKWQSMPELMLRYRAAAWFVRAYAPEIAMGLQTVEEVRDQIINVDAAAPGDTLTLDALQPAESADADVPEQQGAVKEPHTHRAEPEAAPKQAVEDAPHQQAQQAVLSATPTEEAARAPQGPQKMPTFECPRPNKDGSPRIVDESVCMDCKDRPGCPEWAGDY